MTDDGTVLTMDTTLTEYECSLEISDLLHIGVFLLGKSFKALEASVAFYKKKMGISVLRVLSFFKFK